MYRALIVAFILASSCLALAEAEPAGASVSPDFSMIAHFALLNQYVRYDTVGEIERKWSAEYGEIYVVDIHRTRNRYLLGIDERKRVQDIAIRGTVNLRNAFYDLRFLKVMSPALGISLFHGFDSMALALYENMAPHLRKDYPVRVSGQSLGAAEAVILAMLLMKKGYRIEQIVTFGQPKVTDAAGAAAFAHLPLLRIVDMNDIVPLMPPPSIYPQDPYVHFGTEIVLLEGKHYCVATPAFANRKPPDGLVDRLLSVQEIKTLLHEHSISSYVASIKPKLSGALAVPCSQSGRFMPKPDRIPPDRAPL